MNITPLRDRIYVRRDESLKRTESGIILLEKKDKMQRPATGRVVAVGKGVFLSDGSRRTVNIEVGQEVVFSKHSGTEERIMHEELTVLREEDILAVKI